MSLIAMLLLLLADVAFILCLLLLVAPLFIWRKAAAAVLKRNFIGYFSNPTGYVFLCLFVLLTSFAAFWPHEFFNTNLANLDQLNKYLPLIMLVFIPAITMGVWSDERRQGTDELLLTLPAGDFDIVVGKYLAAASTFTVSLLFSQIAVYAVLVWVAHDPVTHEVQLDLGLIFTNYLGYWVIGLAMIAIGMVASFLTSNLTVGFILGMAFNAPFAFAAKADVIAPTAGTARAIARWGLGEQFEPFGRGVLSLASLTYFGMLVAVGLYLSIILIGRRHWSGGRDGSSMLGHFLIRVFALILIAFSATYLFTNHDLIRIDTTAGQLSSLSPDTKKIIRELKPKHPIVIDAFVSAQVPESYVQTKYDLVSKLKEFQKSAGSNVQVRIHDNLEPFSDAVALAQERFGIQPQSVRTRTRGKIEDDEVVLGAAFTCGLEKVVVPFFDYGIPVEYELVRSIATVSRGGKKKLGVVRTDARMFGGVDFSAGFQQMPRQEIIDELQKQYDVEEVDPSSPIDEDKFDAIMVVQPSSLGPSELDNVVSAIKAGVPTAIFEDPMPVFLTAATPTGEPKRAPGGGMGGMFGGGGQPMPKGDMRRLWETIGLEVPGEPGMGMDASGFQPDIVWQKYLPYEKLRIQGIPDSWVFCSNEAPEAAGAISGESRVTSGLREVFFPVPGAIKPSSKSELKFTPLVKTGKQAGTIRYSKFRESRNDPRRMTFAQGNPVGEQIIVARIQGAKEGEAKPEKPAEPKADSKTESKTSDARPTPDTSAIVDSDEEDGQDEADKKADENPADEKKTDEGAGKDDKKSDEKPVDKKEEKKEEKPKKERKIDVIYAADIDLMFSAFLRIRARPDEMDEIAWRFENVTFLLNVVDALTKDEDYIGIRKRMPRHSTLRSVEVATQKAREQEVTKRNSFSEDFDAEIKKAEEENKSEIRKFEQKREELEKKQKEGGEVNVAELTAIRQQLAAKQETLSRRLEVKREQLQRKRDREIEKIRRNVDLEVLRIQNWYKWWAVALPPIPPLLVGLVVFVSRMLREREGIAKSRLRT